MIAKSPEHAIELLDAAFNAGDLDTVLRYYEPDAVVIPEPGTEVRGTEELAILYGSFMKPGTTATQIKTHVVEADGIALFTSSWRLSVEGQSPQEFIATTVFRQQPDGGWKALIDNARGPLVLDAD
ncbi:YybH family protein [Lichenicola sp.]|uniref:YybH family protein n=1 Tax=Lichenicola sp. TaxID=2804529 RepID=UPI003B009D6D